MRPRSNLRDLCDLGILLLISVSVCDAVVNITSDHAFKKQARGECRVNHYNLLTVP